MLKPLIYIVLLVAHILSCQAIPPSPVTVGNLILKEDRWVRPTAGRNTAAYLTIANTGSEPDRLVRVDCEDANVVELHNHINDNGIMRMRPVEAIEIASEPVEMKPGGLHIMLMGLKDSFRNKDVVHLTLHFEKAGPVSVAFPVQTPKT